MLRITREAKAQALRPARAAVSQVGTFLLHKPKHADTLIARKLATTKRLAVPIFG